MIVQVLFIRCFFPKKTRTLMPLRMTSLLTCVNQSIEIPAEQEKTSGPKDFTLGLDFNAQLATLHQKLDSLSGKMMKAINKLKLSTIEDNIGFHNNFSKLNEEMKIIIIPVYSILIENHQQH